MFLPVIAGGNVSGLDSNQESTLDQESTLYWLFPRIVQVRYSKCLYPSLCLYLTIYQRWFESSYLIQVSNKTQLDYGYVLAIL